MTAPNILPVLDDMTLTELNTLASAIVGLKEAGYLMHEQGFIPSFSMVPGQPVLMRLNLQMPTLAGAFVSTPGIYPPPPSAEFFPAPMTPPVPAPPPYVSPTSSAAPRKPAPARIIGAAEIDAAVNAACDTVLPKMAQQAAEPPTPKLEVRPVEAPHKAPVEAQPKAEVVASCAPSALSRAHPNNWTVQEDADLVRIVAEEMVLRGKTKAAAIAAAAAAAFVGRPEPGSEYRLKTKLADQLAGAMAELRAAPALPVDPAPKAAAAPVAEPAPAPQPAAEPAAEPAPKANADWRPEHALSAATLSPIEQHLLDMPTKGGWTLEADLDLLELSELGWTIPEIATEMGRDGRAVTERFDLLTGYDRETKTRKWARAALLLAAREWAAKRAPASAAE